MILDGERSLGIGVPRANRIGEPSSTVKHGICSCHEIIAAVSSQHKRHLGGGSE